MSEPEQPGPNRVRRVAIIIALLGLVLATGIIGYVGFGKVATAFAEIGWRGLFGLCLTYLVPVGLLAAAWLVLDPGAPHSSIASMHWATERRWFSISSG